jgi:hypothetical protein
LSVQLGARHFGSEGALLRAVTLNALGDRKTGLDEARRAVALARASSMTFLGPACLAGVAAITEDQAERDAAIAEMMQLLEEGSIAHNHYIAYRVLIEADVLARDWVNARKWAEALKSFAAPEPFYCATLFSSAGLAVARHGLGDRGTAAEARAIAADAQAHGFTHAARWIGDCVA